MALTPSDRATFKKEIAQRLSPQSWAEIDLVLNEFGASTTDFWQGADRFAYIVEMLKNVGDTVLSQLAAHLSIETGVGSVLDPPAFWSENQLRVFISHLAKNKIYASQLQTELAACGISCFVAHEDIEPDAEWQGEIEKALRTCDALVALLHEGFHESIWTDQEVGYALGRGVPVFSIRLDIAPYGLFGKKQAFNGKNKDISAIARELLDAYRKHPKTQEKASDAIVEKFCASGSFAEAKANCGLVEQLIFWRPGYKARIRDAIKDNSQISGSWGVPARIETVLAKRDPDPPEAATASGLGEEIPF
jgi:nucleoside 2-deoxyribosyltransferase